MLAARRPISRSPGAVFRIARKVGDRIFKLGGEGKVIESPIIGLDRVRAVWLHIAPLSLAKIEL